MVLTEEVKAKIVEILDSVEFVSDLYEGLDKKKREELGQVYTPAKVCIQMLESFSCDTFTDKTILDPACGSGNLLIACLIAGADSDKLYGNELDPIAVKLCKKRVNRACDLLGKPRVNDWQIHRGDATNQYCLTVFGPEYRWQEQAPGDLFSAFF
jgi:predicted RNA methylase